MRAFIALEVPESFASEVAELARTLSAMVTGRFMPRENYHLTLAFLGEVGEAGARCAIEAIDAACALRSGDPVMLNAEGLGTFGKPRDATLWLGIEPAEGLMRFANDVRAELKGRSIAYDTKPFRPHITIARRARVPQQALPVLAFPQPVPALAITLFKSELSSSGATYKPLYRVEL